jgi:hypothetical protein
MTDREYAWLEACTVAASDAYFKGRPHIDSFPNRMIFEAGFMRGAAQLPRMPDFTAPATAHDGGAKP